MRPTKLNVAVVVVATVLAAADGALAQRGPRGQFPAGVYKWRIVPHWFQDNERFWYRNDLRGGAKEFVAVDVRSGTRQPAFDHGRLAAALSKAAGAEHAPEKLPFDEIEFVEGAKAVRFTAGGAAWRCDLASYECTKTDAPAAGAGRREEEDDDAN